MMFKEKKGSNPNQISDLFASFFQEVYKTEHNINNGQFNDAQLNSNPVIPVPNIVPEDVVSAIGKFKEGCGPDGIPSFFIKLFDKALAVPLSIIFNTSLSEGIFPDIWKISKITPIFKSGKRDDVTNYRGVSKLSSIPKLFESMVCDYLYFKVKHIISIKQHGFVRGRSTTTNLMEFTRKVITNMESKTQTDTVYLDFRKAFDSLIHDIVIKKLHYFGLSDTLIIWLKSYLTDRLQYVGIDDVRSRDINVYSGVPQGSHLGPLIFILFINDISDVVQFSECLLYADDMKLHLAIENVHDAEKLQMDIDAISIWCFNNGLTLNVSKCKVMSFHRSLERIDTNYVVSGESLVRVHQIKDLGVTFLPSMSFNLHMDLIIAKALSMLGFVKRISKDFKDPFIFLKLYCAYVRPQLEYASVIWSPYYEAHIQRIEGIQKKFVIGLACKLGLMPYDATTPFWEKVKNLPPYIDMCKDLHIETLETRRQFAGALFVSDLLNGNMNCSSVLELLNLQVPRRAARQHEFLSLNFHRTNYGTNEPINLVSKCFNKYANLFDFQPKHIFKKQLKGSV